MVSISALSLLMIEIISVYGQLEKGKLVVQCKSWNLVNTDMEFRAMKYD